MCINLQRAIKSNLNKLMLDKTQQFRKRMMHQLSENISGNFKCVKTSKYQLLISLINNRLSLKWQPIFVHYFFHKKHIQILPFRFAPVAGVGLIMARFHTFMSFGRAIILMLSNGYIFKMAPRIFSRQ